MGVLSWAPPLYVTSGDLKSHGICFRYCLPCALYFGRLVVEAAEMGLSAYSARNHMAASRVHPTMVSDLVEQSRAA